MDCLRFDEAVISNPPVHEKWVYSPPDRNFVKVPGIEDTDRH